MPFSSALKNKQTNKVHKPTKKLKQLCQHYGVGSELALGEGGVETKKEREEAGMGGGGEGGEHRLASG